MAEQYALFTLLGKSLSELFEQSKNLGIAFQKALEEVDGNYYITAEGAGIGFVFDANKTLITIHLHGKAKDQHESFSGPMPFGLHFSDSPEIARRKIGVKPIQEGGGNVLPILGLTNKWEKYFISNGFLHIEFESGGIGMVTLSTE